LTKRLPTLRGASKRLTYHLHKNLHEIVDRHESVSPMGIGT